MNAEQVIAACRARGLTVYVLDGQPRVKGPRAQITPALLALLDSFRSEIVGLLAPGTEPAPPPRESGRPPCESGRPLSHGAIAKADGRPPYRLRRWRLILRGPGGKVERLAEFDPPVDWDRVDEAIGRWRAARPAGCWVVLEWDDLAHGRWAEDGRWECTGGV